MPNIFLSELVVAFSGSWTQLFLLPDNLSWATLSLAVRRPATDEKVTPGSQTVRVGLVTEFVVLPLSLKSQDMINK